MLIKNRKSGEAIILDDGIEATEADTQGNNPRAEMDAPKEVTDYREEIHQRMSDYTAPPYG